MSLQHQADLLQLKDMSIEFIGNVFWLAKVKGEEKHFAKKYIEASLSESDYSRVRALSYELKRAYFELGYLVYNYLKSEANILNLKLSDIKIKGREALNLILEHHFDFDSENNLVILELFGIIFTSGSDLQIDIPSPKEGQKRKHKAFSEHLLKYINNSYRYTLVKINNK